MKVLVTGAGGGQIGGLLAMTLASSSYGYEVIALGHRTPPPMELQRGAECIQADLAENLLHLPKVDAIVHAAARTPVTWNGHPSDYVRSNISGMERLVEYARRARVAFLLNLSTLSIYGELPDGEVDEKTPFYSPDIYGATKYVGERILAASSDDIPSLSLRLPGVLAPGNFGPWIGNVMQKALSRAPITVYNPNAPFNNVIDVDELARFSDHILKSRPKKIGAVNWGADCPSTVHDVVQLIVEHVNWQCAVTEVPSSKPSFWIKTDRIREQCAFHPAQTVDMISRYVRDTLRLHARAASAVLPGSHAKPGV